METTIKKACLEDYYSVKDYITKREKQKKENKQLKDFHFLSANLANFLPDIPREQHEDIYLNLLYSHSLMITEPNYPGLINTIIYKGDTSCLNNTYDPAIFCTYHLGSYRAIIGALASKGKDFVLLVDKKTYEEQREKVIDNVALIHDHFKENAFFELEDAEQYDIAIRLIKHIKAGRSIVAYLDGNTGVGGIYKKDPQLLKLNFLKQPVLSRKGISTLSYATKTPIIPVISYYEKKEKAPTLAFYDLIDPNKWTQDKDSFCLSITSKLYEILENNLIKYYDQWEGWIYVHKYLDWEIVRTRHNSDHVPKESITECQLVFNKDKYALFKMDDACFLLNRRSYESFQLESTLFEFLDNNPVVTKEIILKNGLPEILLQRLISKHIYLPFSK
ncbi:MAG: hypothetical protein AAGI07_01295 [Bacteroidota bacterium]